MTQQPTFDPYAEYRRLFADWAADPENREKWRAMDAEAARLNAAEDRLITAVLASDGEPE